MLKFRITVDDSDIDKLRQFESEFQQIQKKILAEISEAVVGRSVKNYLSGQALQRRSGDLAQSINYEIRGNTAFIGSNLVYARIHELGGVIKPKRGKFLHFFIGDKEFFLKEVTMPRRPYLEPAMKDVFASGAANLIAEKRLRTEINKRFR